MTYIKKRRISSGTKKRSCLIQMISAGEFSSVWQKIQSRLSVSYVYQLGTSKMNKILTDSLKNVSTNKNFAGRKMLAKTKTSAQCITLALIL